ncbi:hypothetical protein R1flu_010250 [Riccia fluitans]|uniref:Nudix hydrolase domain-containing protein n=1 Tax=Riccia fluitans TaxID=41844 RepID=A0ABD1Z5C8_9MARC
MAAVSNNPFAPVKYHAFPWKETQEEWISPKLKSIAQQLRRAGSLSSHSGEVALPGGKRDEEDVDDAATALREAREEIGLEPSHVRVIAQLEPFLSKHLLGVIPVIGMLDDMRKYDPKPNPGEVESVFEAPLEMFLKESENHWWKEREWLGVNYRVHFFDYTTPDGQKFLIWGLTASILIRAASLIFERQPDFEEFGPDVTAILKSSQGSVGRYNLNWSPETKIEADMDSHGRWQNVFQLSLTQPHHIIQLPSSNARVADPEVEVALVRDAIRWSAYYSVP